MPNPGARYGRFPLRDSVRLRELTLLVITNKEYGSARKAAKKLGLERRTFANLLRKARGQTVAQKTLGALETAFDKIDPTGRRRLHRRLAECFMPPAVRRFYDQTYGAWCQERLTRFERVHGRLWRMSGDGRPWLVPAREGRTWRQMVLDDLMQQAEKSRDTAAVVALYRRRMNKMGVPQERQEVALLRVVEPLAEWMAMGGLQRRWRDLSPKERRAFVRRGFLREIILLRGEHPQLRAARLLAGVGT